MRKPSRLMPKYQEKETPLFLGVLAGLLFITLILPLALLAAPIMLVMGGGRDYDWYKDALVQRANESICTFARSFNCRTVDTWVIRAVYEQLQDYIGCIEKKNFPLRATDRLDEDLNIDDEDFHLDVIEEIYQRTGRSSRNWQSNPLCHKVETVGDLVHFLNAQPMTGKLR